jgi:predicted metal-dependent hydrolase
MTDEEIIQYVVSTLEELENNYNEIVRNNNTLTVTNYEDMLKNSLNLLNDIRRFHTNREVKQLRFERINKLIEELF